MCWITLTPKKRKHHHHDHHSHLPHFHHHHEDDHDTSIEHLVRRDRNRISFDESVQTTSFPSHHHHSKIRIVTPSDHHLHLNHKHHHHHHHMHPLHLHPVHLHGHGKKRVPQVAPRPPPPSRCTSREPTYRIQPIVDPPHYSTVVVEPDVREIRETTRIALREARPERRRLRRVAGYELLGRDVPWSWDCVSSVAESDRRGREIRRGGGLRFPPFGSPGSWM